jgi:hypothetical protein
VKKIVFYLFATIAGLMGTLNMHAQCSLAKFNTANGSVSGASLSTYDIHAGDVNKDGFQDIVYEGASGPFLYLNSTSKKAGLVTFNSTADWSYTHKTTESFISNNCADMNQDTLADIVEFYGNYLYFFRKMVESQP